MNYVEKKVLGRLTLCSVLSFVMLTTSCRAEKNKDDLIEVSLTTMFDTGDGSVLVLKATNDAQFLTIGIGDPETRAIVLGLKRFHGKNVIPLERPLTHNLMLDLLGKLGAKIEKIVVNDFQKDIFYANIFLTTNGGKELIIDARPSDAIALAVTMTKPVPMFVVKKVMEEAGNKNLSPEEKQKTKPIKL